jgi:hypothetical protein
MKLATTVMIGPVCMMLLFSAPWVGAQQLKPSAVQHQYVGVAKCAICHKSEAIGNQYGHWMKSKHSQAFAALATPAALEFAKKRGIQGPPQKAGECLKCHTTGWGKPASAFASPIKPEEGVGCEACHGPGSDFRAINIMKDHNAAIAAGLWSPDEHTCTTCHNQESPTFKGFDFKTFAAKIEHANPKKMKK